MLSTKIIGSKLGGGGTDRFRLDRCKTGFALVRRLNGVERETVASAWRLLLSIASPHLRGCAVRVQPLGLASDAGRLRNRSVGGGSLLGR